MPEPPDDAKVLIDWGKMPVDGGRLPAVPFSLTPEQRQQMRQEMLVQAAAKVENARVNLLMARAAYAALLSDHE